MDTHVDVHIDVSFFVALINTLSFFLLFTYLLNLRFVSSLTTIPPSYSISFSFIYSFAFISFTHSYFIFLSWTRSFILYLFLSLCLSLQIDGERGRGREANKGCKRCATIVTVLSTCHRPWNVSKIWNIKKPKQSTNWIKRQKECTV